MSGITQDHPQSTRAGYIVLSVLVLVAAGFWWAMFAMMHGMESMEGMGGMPMPVWSIGSILGMAIMWVMMMAAMMIPAAAPVILSYTKLQSKEHRGLALGKLTTLFSAGYLAIWSGVAVLLAILQLWFAGTGLFTQMGAQATPLAAAILMLLAGIWQLTAIKDFCLEHCRHPMTFLIGHWREGAVGALRMGVHHGWYCVGCCIALMGLMFVFGSMNVLWMAVITAYFLAEKLLPGAEIWGRWVGYLLIGAGLLVLARTLLF